MLNHFVGLALEGSTRHFFSFYGKLKILYVNFDCDFPLLKAPNLLVSDESSNQRNFWLKKYMEFHEKYKPNEFSRYLLRNTKFHKKRKKEEHFKFSESKMAFKRIEVLLKARENIFPSLPSTCTGITSSIISAAPSYSFSFFSHLYSSVQ